MRLNVGIVEEADDAEFEILTRSSWPRVTLGLFCKSMGVLVNFANFLEKLQLNLALLFVSNSEALQAKTNFFCATVNFEIYEIHFSLLSRFILDEQLKDTKENIHLDIYIMYLYKCILKHKISSFTATTITTLTTTNY